MTYHVSGRTLNAPYVHQNSERPLNWPRLLGCFFLTRTKLSDLSGSRHMQIHIIYNLSILNVARKS